MEMLPRVLSLQPVARTMVRVLYSSIPFSVYAETTYPSGPAFFISLTCLESRISAPAISASRRALTAYSGPVSSQL